MDDALVCLSILFALLMPVVLFHVWATGTLAGASNGASLRAPRLKYVPPPAPMPAAAAQLRQAGPARYRPAQPWARALPAQPKPEPPARASLPLAVQARQSVAEGSRARIVRLAADVDPGQRGLWLKYLIEQDGICFN